MVTKRELNYWHFASPHVVDEILNRMGWKKSSTSLPSIYQVVIPAEDADLFDFIFDQF